MGALKTEQLTVNYDKTPVLWEVSCAIPEGVMVGVIGPNGAGKSTLLKAAVDLVKPLGGKVEIFDAPFKKVRSRVAYVPQRNAVDWDFPIVVSDVVLMGRYGKMGIFRRPSLADREAAQAALDRVGMLSFAHRQISALSGGQQQRVFLARALMQDADLYLLDEPFAGIDASTEQEVMAILKGLIAQGKTVIIVHHDLSSIEAYFDWVLLLNTCLIGCGPTSEVFHAENIARTYGRSGVLLDEAAKLSQNRFSGLR